MATTTDQAINAILDRITQLAPEAQSELNARAILDLAEAYAWLKSPANPHGGNVSSK